LIRRSQPPSDLLGNLITYSAEDLQAIRIGALCIGRIIKTPMQLDVPSGIRRARCVGVITDRNDVVEMSSLEFGNVLRAMTRDIDSQLSHHLNSSWIHTNRVGPRTQNLKLAFSEVAQPSFRHLTAAGVART
jgi:hypothetical protein